MSHNFITSVLSILAVHDQSHNDWQCWAYAVTTMFRSSLRRLIEHSTQREQISQDLRQALQNELDHPDNHKLMRTELMSIVFPTRLNTDPGEESTGDLAGVIDRVGSNIYLNHYVNKI